MKSRFMKSIKSKLASGMVVAMITTSAMPALVVASDTLSIGTSAPLIQQSTDLEQNKGPITELDFRAGVVFTVLGTP
jgi:hypothetical protein